MCRYCAIFVNCFFSFVRIVENFSIFCAFFLHVVSMFSHVVLKTTCNGFICHITLLLGMAKVFFLTFFRLTKNVNTLMLYIIQWDTFKLYNATYCLYAQYRALPYSHDPNSIKLLSPLYQNPINTIFAY